ncbi:hypothetical protein NEIRO03_1738 [Nematocida sp. AWRm78]|nr:hypothetical protein NEIRO02_1786 [Nematocida sp. AWRm79]KAI5184461.1 hypothetical protein NEIRO03_1738 [Nematocida sp. AWRm78]
MKTSMIIKLLIMMYTVCARLEMGGIVKICDKKYGKLEDMTINQSGPLNPLRGYIIYKSGYMHNKRLYAPEINTKYSIEKITKNGEEYYNYTRSSAKDEPHKGCYKEIDEKKKKSIVSYHEQLIKMFPCRDGTLSIVASEDTSMYSFLMKDEVKSECMTIMAALFLLSEQVDIPIDVKEEEGEKKLILKSVDGNILYINQMNPSNSLKELIDFLRKYIEDANANPSVKMEASNKEPTNYEQFMTGDFLNTPQFLIQTYINEFIDSEDRYIEFVNNVYTLLCEQIENTNSTPEKIEKAKEVFKRCFTQEKADLNQKPECSSVETPVSLNAVKHTDIIYELKKVIDKNTVFPFNNSLQLPAYIRAKLRDWETKEIIDSGEGKYANCVETGILGLVCCLMYDPIKKEYNTGDLPDTDGAARLKLFFKTYNVPAEVTNHKMHEDWSGVVACINSKNITYVSKTAKGNELECGLLNILHVLSYITGNKEEVTKEISLLKDMCIDENLNKKFDIKGHLTNILKVLSNNKNVEIEYNKFTVNKREDDNIDLFGEFKLVYTYDNMAMKGIRIRIVKRHTSLDVFQHSLNENDIKIQNKLKEINDLYINAEYYIECLIKQYTNIELAEMENLFNGIETTTKKRVQDVISKSKDSVSSLLLSGRIAMVDYKEYIVKYILMSYDTQALNKTSVLARFINNLIGSTLLEDGEIRENMLIWFIYNMKVKKHYDRIEKLFGDFPKCNKDVFRKVTSDLFGAFESYPENTVSICFTRLIKEACSNGNIAYDIIRGQINMLGYLVKFAERSTKDPIKAFTKQLDIIKREFTKTNQIKLSDLYFNWFVDIIILNNDHIKHDKNALMKCLFDLIDEDSISDGTDEPIDLNPSRIFNAIEYLNVHGDDLYSKGDERGSSKCDRIIKILRTRNEKLKEALLGDPEDDEE